MSTSRPTIAAEPSFEDIPVLPHPSLFLDADDVSRHRGYLADPVRGAPFAALKARCDALLDPADPDHPDWQTLADPRWRLRQGLSFAVQPVELLAIADAITGDERYGDFAKGIVFAIIRNGLADTTYTYDWGALNEKTPYPGWRRNTGHDNGRFMVALAVFYDHLGHRLSADERTEFLAYAVECLGYVAANQSEVGRMGLNNRGARCAIGNGLLALAIHGEPGVDPAVIASAMRIAVYTANAWCTYAIGRDGGSFEGVSYCQTTAILQAQFGLACERRGFRHLGRHPNLRHLADFTLYNLAPTHEYALPVNDCSRQICAETSLVLATVHANGVHRWLYDELIAKQRDGDYLASHFLVERLLFDDPAVTPVHPAGAGYPLARHFRDKGVVAAYSSWEPDAAHVLFFAGPHVYGGHRQDDELSFVFSALGESFAWDGGYDTFGGVYANRAYRRSEYHNTLLIDGLGQCGYDGRYWPRGVIADYRDDECGVFAAGDGSRCYGIDGVIDRCERRLLFRRGDFPCLIVTDDVQPDDREHDVTWNFVVHPEVELAPDATGGWVLTGKRGSLHLIVLADGPAIIRQDVAGAMPRLQVTVRGVRCRFAALLLPAWPGLDEWSFAADFAGDVPAVELALNGHTNRLTMA